MPYEENERQKSYREASMVVDTSNTGSSGGKGRKIMSSRST
jgi:hypothetical protein